MKDKSSVEVFLTNAPQGLYKSIKGKQLQLFPLNALFVSISYGIAHLINQGNYINIMLIWRLITDNTLKAILLYYDKWFLQN